MNPRHPDRGDAPAPDDELLEDELDADGAPAWLTHYQDEYLVDLSSYAASTSGIIYLVGAGPGDPGLLTVRARALLDRCDAIVHDALTHAAMLERSDPDAPPPELHFVGKRGGDERSAKQEDINALLVRLGREGKRVVRLKGGDPFVFGRGSEEAQALAEAGVAFEVVPGITSGIAAPAYAGIPVTHRGIATSLTLVTGHESPDKAATQTDWAAMARIGAAGTLAVYMGVKQLPRIAAALIDGGLPAEIPAAAIEWGTYPRQRTVVATLGTLAQAMSDAGIEPPVITVIGWTVVLRDEIAWFDQRPLHGRRVLVTRPSRGSALAARLREHGAEVLSLPTTRIESTEAEELQDTLQWLEQYDWIVFTSQNAVRIFWEALRASGRDARALARSRLAVVGPATGEALLAHGLAVDVVAERFVAEGVLEALEQRPDIIGSRVLYLTAEGAREVLRDGLEDLGATVETLVLYRSVTDADAATPLRDAIGRGEVDVATFTAASTVRGFVEAVGEELARTVPAVTIGPSTSEAARSLGLDVRAEAGEATLAALVRAVEDVVVGLAPRRAP